MYPVLPPPAAPAPDTPVSVRSTCPPPSYRNPRARGMGHSRWARAWARLCPRIKQRRARNTRHAPALASALCTTSKSRSSLSPPSPTPPPPSAVQLQAPPPPWRHTPSINTGGLPLNCSGNPGVDGASHRGVMGTCGAISAPSSSSRPPSGAYFMTPPHRLAASFPPPPGCRTHPFNTGCLPLSYSGNPGVNSQY